MLWLIIFRALFNVREALIQISLQKIIEIG